MKRAAPILAAVVLLSGCGGSDNDAEVAELREQVAALNAQLGDETPTDDAADKTPSDDGPAKLGATQTIADDDTGAKIAVTAAKVHDPVTVGSYDQKDIGAKKRFVGVDLRISNTGETLWESFPRGVLIYGDDEQVEEETVIGGPCASFSDELRIMKGSSRKGCLAFPIPKGSTPKVFQFVSDGVPLEWAVR